MAAAARNGRAAVALLLIVRAVTGDATVVKGAFKVQLITPAIFWIASVVALLAAAPVRILSVAFAFGLMADGAFPKLRHALFIGSVMATGTSRRRARFERPVGIGIAPTLVRLMIKAHRAAFANAAHIEQYDRAISLRLRCRGGQSAAPGH